MLHEILHEINYRLPSHYMIGKPVIAPTYTLNPDFMYLLCTTGFLSILKPDVSPTIRQISILKIPAIFDLNRSLEGFDKPGVADVSFKCPNRICNKSMTFDSLNSLKNHKLTGKWDTGKLYSLKEPVKIGEGNNKAKITYNIHFQAYQLILLNPLVLSTLFLYQRGIKPGKIWQLVSQ